MGQKSIVFALGSFLLSAALAVGQTDGAGSVRAQFFAEPAHDVTASAPLDRGSLGALPVPPSLNLPPSPPPRMAAELALQSYWRRAERQLLELGAYSDTTIVEAELPESSQRGKFELRRSYQAPRSLAFHALRFAGDGFVKSNVITRLLQSEVSHVEKGEGPSTAITEANYKFSYKGTDVIDGREVYVYHLKPRAKRAGLFKGKIYVDAYSGSLRRAEGTMVKSPSFFVKKIEFVQDYIEVGAFSLPARLHSVANTRLVGRAVVDIIHTDYQARSVAELQPYQSATRGGN